jgi:hypothetical protein
MNLIRAIRRLASIPAALAGTAALACTAAPAAVASARPGRARLLSTAGPPLPPGWNKHPPLPVHAHAAVTGWQATLIGVALLVATLAVLAGRAWAVRHKRAKRAASVRHASSGPTPTPAPPVR